VTINDKSHYPFSTQFLQNNLFELLENINLGTRQQRMWFQHDGALAYRAAIVRDYLHQILNDG